MVEKDYNQEHSFLLNFTAALFNKNSLSPGTGTVLRYKNHYFVLTNEHIINTSEILFAGLNFLDTTNVKLDEAQYVCEIGNMQDGNFDLAFLEIKNMIQQYSVSINNSGEQQFQKLNPTIQIQLQDYDKVFPNAYQVPKYDPDTIQQYQLKVGQLVLIHGYYGEIKQTKELFYNAVVSQNNLKIGEGKVFGILPSGGSGSGLWGYNNLMNQFQYRGIAFKTNTGPNLLGLTYDQFMNLKVKDLFKGQFTQKIIEDSLFENLVQFIDISQISKSASYIKFLE